MLEQNSLEPKQTRQTTYGECYQWSPYIIKQYVDGLKPC
jgi:hypothetical protein